MGHPAKKQEHRTEVFQDLATVVRVEDTALIVRTELSECRARRAASCLLAPEEGDLVLLAQATDGRAYVLAVLERDESAAARLTFEGDLDIRLPRGRFAVAAQEGVEIFSGKDVSVVSGEVSVRATEGNVVLQSLSYLGSIVQAEVERARVIAASVDTVFDRLSQRVKRAYRFVEESDHLRAKNIDYVAGKTLSVRGENTLVTAEELVKVDGDQIHLG